MSSVTLYRKSYEYVSELLATASIIDALGDNNE